MSNLYNILFIKTGKCATETLRFYLKRYANTNSLAINDKNHEKFFERKKFNVNTNHILYNDKNLLHFANAIDKSLPVLRLSAVRNPIERLYSHYCYGHPRFREGMDFNEWYLKTTSGEIEDYWNVPQWGDRTDNYMWNYMGIKSLDLIHLQYDIIFVKEKFEESLQKLEDVLNFKFKRIENLNVMPDSKGPYEFDSKVIEIFNERNQLDNSLYEYVLKNY